MLNYQRVINIIVGSPIINHTPILPGSSMHFLVTQKPWKSTSWWRSSSLLISSMDHPAPMFCPATTNHVAVADGPAPVFPPQHFGLGKLTQLHAWTISTCSDGDGREGYYDFHVWPFRIKHECGIQNLKWTWKCKHSESRIRDINETTKQTFGKLGSTQHRQGYHQLRFLGVPKSGTSGFVWKEHQWLIILVPTVWWP